MNDTTLHPLTVVSLIQSEDEDVPPRVVLEDDLGRQLDVVIGPCEALAIHMALEHIAMGRPFTHDLFVALLEHLDAQVQRLVIDDLSHGTYFARLFLNGPSGPGNLDCRPSDGLAIALRTNAPILASNRIMTGDEKDD